MFIKKIKLIKMIVQGSFKLGKILPAMIGATAHPAGLKLVS